MHSSPQNASLPLKALLALLLVASASAALLPEDTLAQTKLDGLVDVRFSDKIAGVETTLGGLLGALEMNTIMDGATDKEARFLIVYGIGLEARVYDAIASVPVNFVPGNKPFIGLGEGPLASPWQAFEEPVLGFERPLAGFEEPVLGFEEPVLGFDNPIVSDNPQQVLEGIWGTGGTAIAEGFYGLVLFTMPDPSFPGNQNVQIRHRAAIVPFKAADGPAPGTAQAAAAPPVEAVASAADRSATFALGAYPNPFNPQTMITYALVAPAEVHLAVYDLLGREVALLVDGLREAGGHAAPFDASGLPGGVYLYRLQAGSLAQTGRLTLMK